MDRPPISEIREELSDVAQARTAWGGTFIDLFFNNIDFHESMAARVVREPFAETQIPVLSIEDLIICKVVFNRPKDWVDIAAVGQARLRQLDRGYISHWLTQFLDMDDDRFAKVQNALSY